MMILFLRRCDVKCFILYAHNSSYAGRALDVQLHRRLQRFPLLPHMVLPPTRIVLVHCAPTPLRLQTTTSVHTPAMPDRTSVIALSCDRGQRACEEIDGLGLVSHL